MQKKRLVRRGRRPKPANQRKSKFVFTRVTVLELARIARAARAAGKTKAEFVRAAALAAS